MKGNNLSVEVSGSGGVKAAGIITQSKIQVSGSGTVNAEELISSKSKASVSGLGTVRIHVTEELDAKVSGSGNIYYTGNPGDKQVSVLGSGKITNN